jgi:hypothetical protein
MIQSFADSETELIWSGRQSRKLPLGFVEEKDFAMGGFGAAI